MWECTIELSKHKKQHRVPEPAHFLNRAIEVFRNRRPPIDPRASIRFMTCIAIAWSGGHTTRRTRSTRISNLFGHQEC